MNKHQWLKQALADIYKLKDDDLITVFYVRAILAAIGDSYANKNSMQRRDLIVTTGGSRSAKRDPHKPKAQRAAAAHLEAQEAEAKAKFPEEDI